MRGSYLTQHLSKDAINVIGRMLKNNPKRRISAIQLLDHPWVKGETATTSLIEGSDEKLSQFGEHKTKIGAKVFADIMSWSEESQAAKQTSLIERSFKQFDDKGKGHITMTDIQRANSSRLGADDGSIPGNSKRLSENIGKISDTQAPLSLSGFSKLLSENMKNKYYNKGDVIYVEGQKGDHMYIINSGIVEVKKEESVVDRGRGNFFGEGALFNPLGFRSATVKAKTPVHLMEISREYFDKYLAESDPDLLLTLKEKDSIRKRNRAKKVLRLQANLKQRDFERGDILFSEGEAGNSLFLVEKGVVDVMVKNRTVFSATPENITGEHSVLMNKLRNTTAVCATPDGCQVFEMYGKDFHHTMNKSPDLRASVRTLCLRREFKKAVVFRLRKKFPYDNPRMAFDAARKKGWMVGKSSSKDDLNFDDIAILMRDMDATYTDEEVKEVIQAIQLKSQSANNLSYDEFKKVFIVDIKTSASI